MQDFAEGKCDDKGCGDGAQDDGEGLAPGLQDHGQVQAEAEKDDRVLEDLFGAVADAGLEGGAVLDEEGDDHAQDDGDDRTSDDGKCKSREPGRDRDDETEQKPFYVLAEKFHDKPLFCLLFSFIRP